MDTLPTTCCVCRELIGPDMPSVLQICSCLIVQCQDCAKLRVADNAGTFRSGLPCLVCGERTPPSPAFEQDYKLVEECENFLVAQAFEHFKLNLPRRSSENVDKYKPLLEKYITMGIGDESLLEDILAYTDVDRVKLLIARLECVRGGYARDTSGLIEEDAGDGLPWGPLIYLRFPKNYTLERILNRIAEEWRCGVCMDDLQVNQVPLINCECAFWTCTTCCLQTTLNNVTGYVEGPSCPICRNTSPSTFLSTYAAQEEEKVLLNHIIASKSVGRKYRVNNAKDMRELCLNLHSTYSTSYGDLERYKYQLELMRLPQLTLEAVRHDLKAAGLQGLDAELGPMRLIKVRKNAFVDVFLRCVLGRTPSATPAVTPSCVSALSMQPIDLTAQSFDEVSSALQLFETVTRYSTLDELSRQHSGADIVLKHQQQVKELTSALCQASLSTEASSNTPEIIAERTAMLFRRQRLSCCLCMFDPQSVHYLRLHLRSQHEGEPRALSQLQRLSMDEAPRQERAGGSGLPVLAAAPAQLPSTENLISSDDDSDDDEDIVIVRPNHQGTAAPPIKSHQRPPASSLPSSTPAPPAQLSRQSLHEPAERADRGGIKPSPFDAAAVLAAPSAASATKTPALSVPLAPAAVPKVITSAPATTAMVSASSAPSVNSRRSSSNAAPLSSRLRLPASGAATTAVAVTVAVAVAVAPAPSVAVPPPPVQARSAVMAPVLPFALIAPKPAVPSVTEVRSNVPHSPQPQPSFRIKKKDSNAVAAVDDCDSDEETRSVLRTASQYPNIYKAPPAPSSFSAPFASASGSRAPVAGSAASSFVVPYVPPPPPAHPQVPAFAAPVQPPVRPWAPPLPPRPPAFGPAPQVQERAVFLPSALQPTPLPPPTPPPTPYPTPPPRPPSVFPSANMPSSSIPSSSTPFQAQSAIIASPMPAPRVNIYIYRPPVPLPSPGPLPQYLPRPWLLASQSSASGSVPPEPVAPPLPSPEGISMQMTQVPSKSVAETATPLSEEVVPEQRASREALQRLLAPLQQRLTQQHMQDQEMQHVHRALTYVYKEIDISQNILFFQSFRFQGIYEVVLPCREENEELAAPRMGDYTLSLKLSLLPSDENLFRQQSLAPDSTPLPVDHVDGGLSFAGKVQLFSNMFPVVVLRRALETQWGFTAVITAYCAEDGKSLQSKKSFASLCVAHDQPLIIRPYSPNRIYNAPTTIAGTIYRAAASKPHRGVRVFQRKHSQKAHRPSQLETFMEYQRLRLQMIEDQKVAAVESAASITEPPRVRTLDAALPGEGPEPLHPHPVTLPSNALNLAERGTVLADSTTNSAAPKTVAPSSNFVGTSANNSSSFSSDSDRGDSRWNVSKPKVPSYLDHNPLPHSYSIPASTVNPFQQPVGRASTAHLSYEEQRLLLSSDDDSSDDDRKSKPTALKPSETVSWHITTRKSLDIDIGSSAPKRPRYNTHHFVDQEDDPPSISGGDRDYARSDGRDRDRDRYWERDRDREFNRAGGRGYDRGGQQRGGHSGGPPSSSNQWRK